MTLERRTFLAALGACVTAPTGLAQQVSSLDPIKTVGFNHMTLRVTDVQRSIEFYQGLFGMPIQAWQADTPVLRIGQGPQFMALSGGGSSVAPGIDHLCLNVQGFDIDTSVEHLRQHGLSLIAPASGRLNGQPERIRVRIRGDDFGGAPEGTPELYLTDPDGIVVQLQDETYCGGAGVLGECLSPAEPSPTSGLFTLREYNHFTLFVTDVDRSLTFYQRLFGMPIQIHQASTPLLSAGSGNQFVALGGGWLDDSVGDAATGPRIHHACLTIEDFDPDRVIAALDEYGVKPRGSRPAAPLQVWVAIRMEDRGGAPGGTPELYFSDPDGIEIQLQGVDYCGGSGVLGDDCD